MVISNYFGMTTVESKRKGFIMFKAKEISPIETINKIKNILKICNITVKETWYESNIKNIFSVRIEIEGINYGTNGKGSSREYALASAYGELMERIGNGAIFKMKERQLTNTHFTYFPDEITVDANHLDRILKNNILFHAIKNIANNYELAYKKWRSLINSQNITCIQYQSEINKSKQLVPVNILKVYGSNGMSAGNTIEEAFVQAVSEVFERFAIDKILNNGISPSIIPLDYIEQNFKDIYSIIKEIKSYKYLDVKLMDCSFNYGFPVVCVCVFNKKTHSDSISFGAHPIVEIAMERAINEAFQGRSVSSITNRVYERKRDNRYNRLSILKNGMGYYPYNFYLNNSSCTFTPFNTSSFKNNAEMKQYIIDLCKKNDIEIYTHTISLYGFYVTHVIIPGMSEIIKYDEHQVKFEKMKKIISRIPDFNSLSSIEYQTCLEFMDYTRKNPELWNNISKKPSNQNTEEILLTTLFRGFMCLENYERAAYYNELLKQYVDFDCYSGLVIVIDMKKQRFNNEFIKQFLLYYYCEDTVNSIFHFLEDFGFNPFYKENFDKCTNPSWLNSVAKMKEGIILV